MAVLLFVSFLLCAESMAAGTGPPPEGVSRQRNLAEKRQGHGLVTVQVMWRASNYLDDENWRIHFDPAPRLMVHVALRNGRTDSARTDSLGRAVFRGVPIGTIKLWSQSKKWSQTRTERVIEFDGEPAIDTLWLTERIQGIYR